jgi:hypothetical protein
MFHFKFGTDAPYLPSVPFTASAPRWRIGW